MPQVEVLFFWITIFLYTVSFCGQLFAFVKEKDKWAAYAIRLLWAAFLAHTILGIVRWISGSHAPVTDTYELNLTGAWFTILIFIIFERLKKLPLAVGLVVTPIVFLILGHGFLERTDAVPMGPA